MGSHVLFFLMVVCFTFNAPLSAKIVHLLSLGDVEENLYDHISKDLKNVRKCFKSIAEAGEAKFQFTELRGKNLFQENVNKWLGAEEVGPDDVLVIYYSGHGSRWKKDSTIWPRGTPSEPYKARRIVNGFVWILLRSCQPGLCKFPVNVRSFFLRIYNSFIEI